MKRFRSVALVLMIVVAMFMTLSACGASSRGYNVTVVRYPDFWATPDAYHTLGVASIVNDIDPGRYVKATNKQILQGLAANGTYRGCKIFCVNSLKGVQVGYNDVWLEREGA